MKCLVWKRQTRFVYLTKHDQDEEKRGHARRDVEHHPDVMSQLIQVVYIRNQDGGEEEPNGTAQLNDTEQKE